MNWFPWVVTLSAVLLAGGALINWRWANERADNAQSEMRGMGKARYDAEMQRDAAVAEAKKWKLESQWHYNERERLCGLLESAERRSRHRESQASRQSRAALPQPENVE